MLLALWYFGSSETSVPSKEKAAKVLPPLGELLVQTQFKWAQTVGVGLRLAGLLALLVSIESVCNPLVAGRIYVATLAVVACIRIR